ncbi:MAG: thiazole biosynthesis adenylyltransferase ThiF [Desulfatiglans sp.]|jgi:adenylyltransferase/sulfurtransferase|nr:thiazole biosynthesis adenylyltransferase ThiF [Desulfatiglans sp.]
MIDNRYSKQILFNNIGPEGQKRISASTVIVVGIGALGTVISSQLCRAGVGRLILVDRDFVEITNLQRQILFTENDARLKLPKAIAAAESLRAVNSEIIIEPIIADVTSRNIEKLVNESDLILDGNDNFEIRFLINDAALKLNKPWIYGGALGSYGMSMNIIPGQTACLRCLMPKSPPPGNLPTCDTDGVISPATGIVASIQTAEALKILTGNHPRKSLIHFDLWDGKFNEFTVHRRDGCLACEKGVYEYLNTSNISWATVLCGRNSVQIVPPEEIQVSLTDLKGRLERIGSARYNGFMLVFEAEGYEMTIFPTGRAIIRGTTDESAARAIYSRYVGL